MSKCEKEARRIDAQMFYDDLYADDEEYSDFREENIKKIMKMLRDGRRAEAQALAV